MPKMATDELLKQALLHITI